MSENLGYHNLYACWVPKQLTDVHKTRRNNSRKVFLECLEMEGEHFGSYKKLIIHK